MSSPFPSPTVRYDRKRVSSLQKFAVAFYSTDFLETCTNDGPHGDTPSVIFSEFLSWYSTDFTQCAPDIARAA